jgi:hypothetical protein
MHQNGGIASILDFEGALKNFAYMESGVHWLSKSSFYLTTPNRPSIALLLGVTILICAPYLSSLVAGFLSMKFRSTLCPSNDLGEC